MPGRGYIPGRLPCRIWLAPVACSVTLLVSAGAAAQTAGPDEAVDARGAVAPSLGLTQAQKSAIYNAVSQQRIRASTTRIPLAIGAPVPPSVPLWDLPVDILPEQVGSGHSGAVLLKYATVEDEVVIVDPIQMRVVDVIHRDARSGAAP